MVSVKTTSKAVCAMQTQSRQFRESLIYYFPKDYPKFGAYNRNQRRHLKQPLSESRLEGESECV